MIINVNNIEIEVKDIPGYEGKYAATKDGRIYTYKNKRFLKQGGVPDNYQIVTIGTTSKYVHRLVAMAWLPNPDNLPCIHHKDAHKDNNCVDNLEWCTVEYNLSHVLKRKRKAVYCVELDKRFNSMYEAAKALGGHAPNLTMCINGAQKTFAGYHWQLCE